MKLSFRKAILLYTLLPIIVIFSVFAVKNLITIRKETQQQIEEHMTDLAVSYAGIFDGFLKPIEGAAAINASLIEESEALQVEKIYRLLELQVENNPIIYGAAIAFMPNQFEPERKLFAPYVFRKQGVLTRLDIAESAYDYTNADWEWWNGPVKTGKAMWSEPYFDEGAGNTLMTTYSVPFYKDGKIWGVATADVRLDEISQQILIPGIEGMDIMVLSTTGKVIQYYDEAEIGKTIYEVIDRRFKDVMTYSEHPDVEELEDIKAQLDSLVESMLAGDIGIASVEYSGFEDGYWSFFAPIKSVGWSFSVRVKENEIFSSVYEQFWDSVLFFCLLLVLIVMAVVLVSGRFSRAMERLILRSQRIERLNFQPSDLKKENIEEISQLSHTLNNMCSVLNSQFAIKENIRIADTIRQHSIADHDIKLPGFEIASYSNAGHDICRELIDMKACKLANSAVGQQQTDCAGFLMLDDSDSEIDATVKDGHLRAIFRCMLNQGREIAEIVQQLHSYIHDDLVLHGPVQLWLGLLDSQKATLNSLAMGQNRVLHFKQQQQELEVLPVYEHALASQNSIAKLNTYELILAQGDIVVTVSDGVYGALDQHREQFGIDAVQKLVKQYADHSAQQIAQQIKDKLKVFTGEDFLQTERSVIVIKRNAV